MEGTRVGKGDSSGKGGKSVLSHTRLHASTHSCAGDEDGDVSVVFLLLCLFACLLPCFSVVVWKQLQRSVQSSLHDVSRLCVR